MPTITGADFKLLINDTSISDTNAEIQLDQAISSLNIFLGDNTISNLGGAAGSKTLSVSSKQKGAVQLVAQAIYNNVYKGIENVGVGGLTVTTFNFVNTSNFINYVAAIAEKLNTDELTGTTTESTILL